MKTFKQMLNEAKITKDVAKTVLHLLVQQSGKVTELIYFSNSERDEIKSIYGKIPSYIPKPTTGKPLKDFIEAALGFSTYFSVRNLIHTSSGQTMIKNVFKISYRDLIHKLRI